MEEVDPKDFSKNYTQVRHIYEPLVGGWDLFRHKATGEKMLIKEIKFYSEADRDEYLPRVRDCPVFLSRSDNGFLRCLGYCRKNTSIEDGICYLLYVIFENYETTLEKVILRKIKDSSTFSVKDILKTFTRLAASLEVLSRQDMLHGDVRAGNVAVMADGRLKLIWAPFIKTTTELLTDKTNSHLLKAMNPSPECAEAYNTAMLNMGAMSMYQDIANEMQYPKNDVYSLAVLVLRLHNLYSSEAYYSYAPNLKPATKRIEMSVLKLHSINSKLGLVLNNMLAFDPHDRWDFAQVLDGLEGRMPDAGLVDITDSIKNINRATQSDLGIESLNRNLANDFTWTQGNHEFLNEHNEDLGGSLRLGMGLGQSREFHPDTLKKLGTPFGSTPQKPSHSPGFQSQTPNPHLRKTVSNVVSTPLLLPAAPAQPHTNIFEQRDLAELKIDFISLIESTIFFDNHHRLRSGIKIKESAGSKYVGEMFCGKRHGIGVYYHMNGDVCIGKWSNGSMQGESIYFYKDGSVYVGAIRDNKKDGFGRLLYTNGDVYEGDWHRNKKSGQGLYYYYATENIYEGAWVLNFKEGWGTFYSRNGEWVEGDWKANKLVVKRSSGLDDSLPQIKNIIHFFTNRKDWNEIIQRMQTILSRRTDDNYNYVDAREYEHLSDAVEAERSGAEHIERVVESKLEVKERQSVAGSRRSHLETTSNPRGTLKPLIQLEADQWSEAGSITSLGRKPLEPPSQPAQANKLGSRR